MADKYPDFAELERAERAGRDFLVRVRPLKTRTVVVAPHGGGIEPGTSEIAEAIADDDLTFYAFEGTKSRNNQRLHITSTHFDEPRCVARVTGAERAVTIHGEASTEEVVFLGGRDVGRLDRLREALKRRGFCAKTHARRSLRGLSQSNICNRGMSGAGIQLELSLGLRRTFFQSLSRSGRKTPGGFSFRRPKPDT